MTSMVLSKNTLRKAFGCSLPSNDCHFNINTECVQRPKTAVPGKRRPFTDYPPRCDEVEIKSTDKTINKNISDIVRPKTSYSNRRLSLTDDMVNQNNTADNNCPGRKTTLSSSPTALEDIDIVEYFYDKSIRDIFPSSNEDKIDRNTNNQNNYYCKDGRDRKPDLHQKPNKTRSIKPSLGYDGLSVSRLERVRIHNKPLSKDTTTQMLDTRNNNTRSYRGSVGTTVLQNGHYDVHVGNQMAFNGKSKSFKDKTVMKTDLRRRLHSDADSSCSQKKSSNNRICSFGTSRTSPGFKSSPLQQSNSKEVESFHSSPNALFESERAINKYPNDSRFISRKIQPCSNTNRKTLVEYSTERPESYHYKTNKFPRKLKPIPRRENLRGIDKET